MWPLPCQVRKSFAVKSSSVISRRLGVSRSLVKSQLVAGSAAALAAAFNTPIAAVLFALEEITGDLHAPVLGSVVLSSATAWMVLHLFLGDEPLFHVSGYKLVHPVEFAIYAVLGVFGGLASVAFVKLLLWLRLKFRLWPKWTVWFQPAVGGLTTGLIGWFYPEVMGAGYHYVDGVLNGDVPAEFERVKPFGRPLKHSSIGPVMELVPVFVMVTATP